MIPTSGNRDDKAVLAREVVERLAQRRDVSGEVVLFDDNAVPHFAENIVFIDNDLPPLYEQDENVEGFGGERNRDTVAEQEPLDGVNAEAVKRVKSALTRLRESSAKAILLEC